MGFFSNLRREAETAVAEHAEQIERGIDKVAGFVDRKTEGQHAQRIEKVAEGAKQATQKVARRAGGPSQR